MTTERRDTTPRGRAIREIIGEALADGMLWHRPEGAFEGSCGSIYVLLARAFALGEAHGIERTTAETAAVLKGRGTAQIGNYHAANPHHPTVRHEEG